MEYKSLLKLPFFFFFFFVVIFFFLLLILISVQCFILVLAEALPTISLHSFPPIYTHLEIIFAFLHHASESNLSVERNIERVNEQGYGITRRNLGWENSDGVRFRIIMLNIENRRVTRVLIYET